MTSLSLMSIGRCAFCDVLSRLDGNKTRKGSTPADAKSLKVQCHCPCSARDSTADDKYDIMLITSLPPESLALGYERVTKGMMRQITIVVEDAMLHLSLL